MYGVGINITETHYNENTGEANMTAISDIDGYNSKMATTLDDKLFWLNKVEDIDAVYDFGCADGRMLNRIGKIAPKIKLYGIDNNDEMIKLASENCSKAVYYRALPNGMENNSLLNMSSVIHEIYSYLSPDNVTKLWNEVFKVCKPKYIAIRDFMPSNSIDRASESKDLQAIEETHKLQFADFSKHWGCKNNRSVVHYLMKYRYTENWKREVCENYFPITVEQFMDLIPKDYEVVYYEHYILPYTKNIVKKDFGITLRDNTHVKILLRCQPSAQKR